MTPMLIRQPTSARRPRPGARTGILDRGAGLPLRQYRLCRQAFWSGLTQAVVLGALVICLALFGRSLLLLFARHGAGVNPWLPRAILGLLGVSILLTLRRFLMRLRELRLLRLELAALQLQIQGESASPEG